MDREREGEPDLAQYQLLCNWRRVLPCADGYPAALVEGKRIETPWRLIASSISRGTTRVICGGVCLRAPTRLPRVGRRAVTESPPHGFGRPRRERMAPLALHEGTPGARDATMQHHQPQLIPPAPSGASVAGSQSRTRPAKALPGRASSGSAPWSPPPATSTTNINRNITAAGLYNQLSLP